MTLKLFNPNARTCSALVSLSFGHTFPSEHWLRFPSFPSLMLSIGPEIFTGWVPLGVSSLLQFIFSLVICLFPLADLFPYLLFN